MKTIISLITCCFFTYGLQAQSRSDGIKVHNTYCVTKLSNDSLVLDLAISIINNDSINYYYPKAIEQQLKREAVCYSYKLIRYPHPVLQFHFDVSTKGYNSYDTLLTIRPADTLVVKYSNILLPLKSQKVEVFNYLLPNEQAIKSTIGGAKYLDRYVPGVKVIEYNLIYTKGKINDVITVKNYLSPPKTVNN